MTIREKMKTEYRSPSLHGQLAEAHGRLRLKKMCIRDRGYTAALTNSGWGDEKGPEKGKPLATDQWIFTTVTFDGSEKEMSLYEDGVLIGTEKTQADRCV